MKDSLAKFLYAFSGVVWLVATLAVVGGIVALVFEGSQQAETPLKPGEVRELKVPQLTGRVVDNAKIFDDQKIAVLNHEIRALENATGGQMAILTISSLQGNPLEDYSLKVAETWKLGHKGKDNGLLLLLAIKDRRIRIEVGYGWEGDIPDARAGDIIRSMTPYLSKGDYEGACILAVRMVKSFTAKEKVVKVRPPQSSMSLSGLALLLGLAGILVGFAIFFFATVSDPWELEDRQRSHGSSLVLAFIFYSLYTSILQLLLTIILTSGGSGRSSSRDDDGPYSGGGGSFGGGGASGRW